MAATRVKTAEGVILAVQEERIQLLTTTSQAYLLTLSRGIQWDVGDLERLQKAAARVRVSYTGEPYESSGVVRQITIL